MKATVLCAILLAVSPLAAADTLAIQSSVLKTTYEGVFITHDRAVSLERFTFGSWTSTSEAVTPYTGAGKRQATVKVNGDDYHDCVVLSDESTAQHPRHVLVDCLP